jgi:LDH2 family malate/lactate/ureidoglycolate dehydrogenase
VIYIYIWQEHQNASYPACSNDPTLLSAGHNTAARKKIQWNRMEEYMRYFRNIHPLQGFDSIRLRARRSPETVREREKEGID